MELAAGLRLREFAASYTAAVKDGIRTSRDEIRIAGRLVWRSLIRKEINLTRLDPRSQLQYSRRVSYPRGSCGTRSVLIGPNVFR